MRPTARSVTLLALLAGLPTLAACTGGSGGGSAATATAQPTYPAPPAQAAYPAHPVSVQPAQRAPIHTGGGIVFEGHDWPLEQVLARSRATGKPAMLYFATTWCGYCRKLERETLPSPEVGRHMAGYVNVQYGADGGVGRDLAQRYGVQGFPTLVRIDATGKLAGKFEGFDLPADFVRRIPAP